MRNLKKLSFCVFLLGLLVAAPSVAVEYEIVDLGPLPGGPYATICGINDSGQVIATVTASGSVHAFLWTESSGWQDLGTLGGADSWAEYINNSGQVVGYSQRASEHHHHAFLWTESGGMQDLGTLGGGNSSKAFGINDSGQVFGIANTVYAGPGHAFLWTESDGMIDLGTLGGNVSIEAGNSSGQFVGVGGSLGSHACMWTESDGMIDLGTLGGNHPEPWSIADGINDLGQVVGESTTDLGYVHAFLWTVEGGMQDLFGTLGGNNSYAIGINNLGQVVGNYGGGAFLWTESGGIQDLGPGDAWAINDLGQVAGKLGGHAVMWIPATPETMLAGMALFIMDEVDLGNIDTELEGSLLVKVDAALSALDKDNPNAVKVAMNDLKALINHVEAQIDKKITPEAAAEIIQRANEIIAELGG